MATAFMLIYKYPYIYLLINEYEIHLRAFLMIPLSQDEIRDAIMLVHWNKLRLMIQQNIIIFLVILFFTRGGNFF